MSAEDPLILTAAFDKASTATFQALRDRHFPPDRNIVPAHLTLFHQLPGSAIAEIVSSLRAVPARAMPFSTAGLRFLGRGVAAKVDCPPLTALRQRLATRWDAWLRPQDRQAFHAHVTIQNKAKPEEAKSTFAELSEQLDVLTGVVTGFDLWWYRGGPWETAETVRWETGIAPERGDCP